MARTRIFLFLLLVALGCAITAPVSAMDHIVGGSLGWNVPKNLSYYQDWAKPRTFGIGDKLVFPFTTGVHNVLEVGKKEFDACTQDKVIEMYYKGPLIVDLTEVGEHYYYCAVGTHCEAGQKLSITVTTGLGSAGTGSAEASGPADASGPKSSANPIHNFGVIASLLSFLVSLFI